MANSLTYIAPVAALKKITGLTPAFMRPPYGDYNNNVRQVAAEYGQSVVLWNYDSGDSVGSSWPQLF